MTEPNPIPACLSHLKALERRGRIAGLREAKYAIILLVGRLTYDSPEHREVLALHEEIKRRIAELQATPESTGPEQSTPSSVS
jgi:hypothetical protein